MKKWAQKEKKKRADEMSNTQQISENVYKNLQIKILLWAQKI